MLVTKDDLKNSAYYAGAGIDIQPILRYGDYIKDFIYVSVGIEKNKLIEGIRHCVDSLNNNLENATLKIISISDIKIQDIEHPQTSRLVTERPDYFTENDYRRYVENFRQFYNSRNEYHLEFKLELDLSGHKRIIRLFHITGEALATYDVLYRKQKIASKIFISIQTGIIEIPDRFSNEMFRLSAEKPKIWLRGVWEEHEMYDFRHKSILEPSGDFNVIIGEFINWNPNFDFYIDGVTHKNKPIRIVRAFGEDFLWSNPEHNSINLNGNGISVNKLLKKYNANFAVNYNLVKLHFPLSKLNEIYTEFLSSGESLFKVAILPGGYEAYEVCLKEFYEKFVPLHGKKLEIDIYYNNLSDMIRL